MAGRFINFYWIEMKQGDPSMLTSLLAKFKEGKKPEEEITKVETAKSASSEVFLKTAETKEFVQKWAKKKDRQGRRIYTKRGVTSLLSAMFQVPGLDTDKKIRKSADDILMELRGMDGLQGFLRGWKAKSEGLMKGFKKMVKKAA